MFLRVALLVFARILRSRSEPRILFTTLLFAASCVILFMFAFYTKAGHIEMRRRILWIAVAFSGTLALGRTFERERYGRRSRAAPGAGRPACPGKLLGIVLLLLVAEVALVPAVALLFQASLFAHPASHACW